MVEVTVGAGGAPAGAQDGGLVLCCAELTVRENFLVNPRVRGLGGSGARRCRHAAIPCAAESLTMRPSAGTRSRAETDIAWETSRSRSRRTRTGIVRST